MGFSRFASRLFVRVAALFCTLAGIAYLVTTELYAVTFIACAIALAQAIAVIRFVGRTNRELARFLDSLRYDDFLQTFSMGALGSGFEDLHKTFDDVLARFRDVRLADESRRRYLEVVVEHVPVAILGVHDDGSVELLNNAARRLLNSSSKTTVDALDVYGATFQRDIAQSRPGQRTLTRASLDGLDRHLILSTTQITVGNSSQRLMCLQDIQSELDLNELSAWQDMVRVLSHEILNSLTPISSLARTAADMVGELGQRSSPPDPELLGDLGDAVQTVARRSDGLMRFVRSYRQLTAMPIPTMRTISVKEYFGRLEKLLEAEWAGRGIVLHMREPSDGLQLVADESLLDQAMINILRNAADAATASDQPQVWLEGGVSDRGRLVIEISDNGPGFAPETREKIFLPFFTTKADGSGIGLALARQVMLIHKGAITASARAGGGALFRLTF